MRRSNWARARGAAPPRTPWRRGATGGCGHRGGGRARRSCDRGLAEERKRLEAARAVRLAASRLDDRAREAQPVALAEALGLQHPVREYRQACLDVGRARLVPVEPQLARGGGAEFLDEQPLLARERLPGDQLGRIAGVIGAQHVELLIARDGYAFLGRAARESRRHAPER